ncbi:unnamed protein product [Amoebophrya sp. A25]|nr:unnamed protein product [Amoebophrya sp. A25]|eukprot:GSA25T00004716001.1
MNAQKMLSVPLLQHKNEDHHHDDKVGSGKHLPSDSVAVDETSFSTRRAQTNKDADAERKNSNIVFFSEVLAEAAETLPRQAILENFVHHNPWDMVQAKVRFSELETFLEEHLGEFMPPMERLAWVLAHDLSDCDTSMGGRKKYAATRRRGVEDQKDKDVEKVLVGHQVDHVLDDMELQSASTSFPSTSPNAKQTVSSLHAYGKDRVREALAEICALFLDRGAAKWCPDFADLRGNGGLLWFWAALEGGSDTDDEQCSNGSSSYVKKCAKKVRKEMQVDNDKSRGVIAISIIQECFEEAFDMDWTDAEAIRALLWEMPGYAGMFYRMEKHPSEAPRVVHQAQEVRVKLLDFLALQCIFTRQAMEDMMATFSEARGGRGGGSSTSSSRVKLADFLASRSNVPRFKNGHPHGASSCASHDLQNPSGVAYLDQNMSRRAELEAEYEAITLACLNEDSTSGSRGSSGRGFRLRGGLSFCRGCSDSSWGDDESNHQIATSTPSPTATPSIQTPMPAATSGMLTLRNNEPSSSGSNMKKNLASLSTLASSSMSIVDTIVVVEDHHVESGISGTVVPSSEMNEDVSCLPVAQDGPIEKVTTSVVNDHLVGTTSSSTATTTTGGKGDADVVDHDAQDKNKDLIFSPPSLPPAIPRRNIRPALTLLTCIDERECSFRRHFEDYADVVVGDASSTWNSDKNTENDENMLIETFGVPGFFDFPIRYRAADGGDEMILAPEGNNPPYILEEFEVEPDSAETKRYHFWRRFQARVEVLIERWSFCPVRGLFLAVSLCPFALLHLVLTSFCPNLKRRLFHRLELFVSGHQGCGKPPRTDFRIPFTPEEAATRLAKTFHNIGIGISGEPKDKPTTNHDLPRHQFAPICLILGHGSRTVNNPFDAAHNCGACGGREGGPNARLMARCANDPVIRRLLNSRHNITIPEDTWFIGGYHDTSSDDVELFDVEDHDFVHQGEDLRVVDDQRKMMKLHFVQQVIQRTCERNALERCQRFMLARERVNGCSRRNTSSGGSGAALEHVRDRATDLGEARPELGHATNASVIIGRRLLTKGKFLARRAFLVSYDPWNDDERGSNLENLIAPALIVCSGISLEYLYSTTEGGAGTKVCMNLVGNFGVSQGASGDLLVGLPTQMTEMHVPVRALYVVDAPLDRVKTVLGRRSELRAIVANDWVKLVVRDPNTGKMYRKIEQMMKENESSTSGAWPLDFSEIILFTAGFRFPDADAEQEGKMQQVVSGLSSEDMEQERAHQSSRDDGLSLEEQNPPPPLTTNKNNVSCSVDITRQDLGKGAYNMSSFSSTREDNITRTFVPWTVHLAYAKNMVNYERVVTALTWIGMAGAYIFPRAKSLQNILDLVHLDFIFSPRLIVCWQDLTGIAFALLTACVIAFSRRYLHGDFMYDRFAFLAVLMLLGFNLIVFSGDFRTTAGERGSSSTSSSASFGTAILGCSLIAYASTFLIGAYSDRPTVRQNATFAFFVYQISDLCFLISYGLRSTCGAGARRGVESDVALSPGNSTIDADQIGARTTSAAHPVEEIGSTTTTSDTLAALFLILGACWKTSQFPFVGLFIRAMEGPSPSSALGYAILSAHSGLMLLLVTQPLWAWSVTARLLLFTIGGLTGVLGFLTAQIRADRKGALGAASAATLGCMYALLAVMVGIGDRDGEGAGTSTSSLIDSFFALLAFSHAVLRCGQLLRSHNVLLEHHQRSAALGPHGSQQVVVDSCTYRLAYRAMRFCNGYSRLPRFFYCRMDDLSLVCSSFFLVRRMKLSLKPIFNKTKKSTQQYLFTAVLLFISGTLPFSPLTEMKSTYLTSSGTGISILVGCITVLWSTLVVGFVFSNILKEERFRHIEGHSSGK